MAWWSRCCCLNLRWSAKMRDIAERVTRFKPVQTVIYWAEYLVLTSILLFPMTVYEDYFRERQIWPGDADLRSLAV